MADLAYSPSDGTATRGYSTCFAPKTLHRGDRVGKFNHRQPSHGKTGERGIKRSDYRLIQDKHLGGEPTNRRKLKSIFHTMDRGNAPDACSRIQMTRFCSTVVCML